MFKITRSHNLKLSNRVKFKSNRVTLTRDFAHCIFTYLVPAVVPGLSPHNSPFLLLSRASFNLTPWKRPARSRLFSSTYRWRAITSTFHITNLQIKGKLIFIFLLSYTRIILEYYAVLAECNFHMISFIFFLQYFSPLFLI